MVLPAAVAALASVPPIADATHNVRGIYPHLERTISEKSRFPHIDRLRRIEAISVGRLKPACMLFTTASAVSGHRSPCIVKPAVK
jgi:hypothetical protein